MPGAWILGPEEASCDAVCEEAGGCVEGGWPKDKDAFMEIVSGLGSNCEDLQEGGGDYDPSSQQGHCGWRSPGRSARTNTTRCAATAPTYTRRFCPCRAAPLGLEELALEEVKMKRRLKKSQAAEDPRPRHAGSEPTALFQ